MRARLAQEGKPLPELKQVWFPGVHINCGGGSDDCITDMKGDLDSMSLSQSSCPILIAPQICPLQLMSGCYTAYRHT